MKICYKERKFSPDTEALIACANDILDEYQAAGYTMTLRQLYYQFVSRQIIVFPNTMRSYKRLQTAMSNARLAGLVDWGAIEDRTRELKYEPTWDSPSEILRTCAEQFRLDAWKNQPKAVEVWIEKEALTGVIAPVCDELGVPYFACRGYVSQSEQWEAGRRALRRHNRYGQETIILHLGDHDPSGIDMTRDNADRLDMFGELTVTVHRIALTMAQVNQYQPPPNPAKQTDSRFADYELMYGQSSWELDALDPPVLDQLIRDEVEKHVDRPLMDERLEDSEEARQRLEDLADDWDDE